MVHCVGLSSFSPVDKTTWIYCLVKSLWLENVNTSFRYHPNIKTATENNNIVELNVGVA